MDLPHCNEVSQRGSPLRVKPTSIPAAHNEMANLRTAIAAKRKQAGQGTDYIADRAYDVDALRAWLAQQGIEVVIPARGRRTNLWPHDPERYEGAQRRGTGASAVSNAGGAWPPNMHSVS